MREPSYETIKQYIREGIASGKFPADQAVPSETKLLADFAVSRGTVVRALTDLVAEGVIRRIQGRGSFVNSRGIKHGEQIVSFSAQLQQNYPDAIYSCNNVLRQGAYTSEAHDVVLPEAVKVFFGDTRRSAVVAIDRTHFLDNVPVVYQNVYIDSSVCPLVRELAPNDELMRMYNKCGVKLRPRNESLDLVKCPASVFAMLKLKTKTDVVERVRRTLDQGHQPFEYLVSWEKVRLYKYEYNF